MIPVLKPMLPTVSMVAKYLEQMDKVRIYSNSGPLVRELESRYSKFFGVDPQLVVSVSNATLAIQGCISILPAKKWICPDFTFAATALAMVQARKELFLVDVRRSDWQLDLSRLDALSRDFGIVPVLPFGAPIDLGIYRTFSQVVVDAAASLGAPIPNFNELQECHFVVYSLHATKVLGAGEGALVVCGSVQAAQELRAWCNFGFKEMREAKLIGTNAKMSEVAAAYGLASLDGYDREKNEWQLALDIKNRLVTELNLANLSDFYAGFRPYWIFDSSSADLNKLAHELKLQGIESRPWWVKPISEMTGFTGSFRQLTELEVSKELSRQLIGLPMWRGISESQLNFISQTLAAVLPAL